MNPREVFARSLDHAAEKRVTPAIADAAMRSTSSSERRALKTAHASLEKAHGNLSVAQAATGRARSLLDAIIREGETLDERERREAEARTNRVREAVRTGGKFSFDAAETAVAIRSELDARRVMAERVVADLRSEEVEAEESIEAARKAVSAAITAVMSDEARAVAKRWIVAEAEALSLRARLGRFYGPVERLYAGTDVWRALELNTKDRVDSLARNVDQAVNQAWSYFAASLTRDAEARLDFSELDASERQASPIADVDRVRAEATS